MDSIDFHLLQGQVDEKPRILHHFALFLFFTSWNIWNTSTIVLQSTEIQQLIEQNRIIEAKQRDLLNKL